MVDSLWLVIQHLLWRLVNFTGHSNILPFVIWIELLSLVELHLTNLTNLLKELIYR